MLGTFPAVHPSARSDMSEIRKGSEIFFISLPKNHFLPEIHFVIYKIPFFGLKYFSSKIVRSLDFTGFTVMSYFLSNHLFQFLRRWKRKAKLGILRKDKGESICHRSRWGMKACTACPCRRWTAFCGRESSQWTNITGSTSWTTRNLRRFFLRSLAENGVA